ncbi:MAG: hypothetical protein AAB676_08495 [Verrucomicrobiota bacterium]
MFETMDRFEKALVKGKGETLTNGSLALFIVPTLDVEIQRSQHIATEKNTLSQVPSAQAQQGQLPVCKRLPQRSRVSEFFRALGEFHTFTSVRCDHVQHACQILNVVPPKNCLCCDLHNYGSGQAGVRDASAIGIYCIKGN